jgi:hypothetical protein
VREFEKLFAFSSFLCKNVTFWIFLSHFALNMHTKRQNGLQNRAQDEKSPTLPFLFYTKRLKNHEKSLERGQRSWKG